jgi:hypothetical protein
MQHVYVYVIYNVESLYRLLPLGTQSHSHGATAQRLFIILTGSHAPVFAPPYAAVVHDTDRPIFSQKLSADHSTQHSDSR